MTTTELLLEFDRLPDAEKIILAASIEKRLHSQTFSADDRRAIARRLRGAVRWPGAMLNDTDAKDLRDEYLARKFS